MPIIKAYVDSNYEVEIMQSHIKRDWMDIYDDAHPYKCLPVVLANTMGWSISFKEDIEFIWDGITDTSPNHISITKGERVCSLGRANATLSFNTGIVFESDEEISLLILPPSNLFIDGVYPYTAIISPSVLKSDLPVAWRITSANKKIFIPAGTPIAQIVPIKAKHINETILEIYKKDENKFGLKYHEKMNSYLQGILDLMKNGTPYSNFYRNAINEKGESLGSHEIKSFKMNIIDNR